MTEKVVFWYGCNVLRHGDIIHGALSLLRAVGIDAKAVGGPTYCCGTQKDHHLQAAEGMARRTVQRFNESGRDKVVTWCPSCHRHVGSFMTAYTEPRFEVEHFSPLLHARRELLARHLTRRVEARVLLHRHLGFREVEVNPLVADLLRLVPGLEVIDAPFDAPGHMCSALQAVPAAVRDVNNRTVAAAKAADASIVATIYHSCQRTLCGLEAAEPLRVVNWVALLARSLGVDAEDEYGAWKNAADVPAVEALVGEERLERVGREFFERALLPEIRSKPLR